MRRRTFAAVLECVGHVGHSCRVGGSPRPPAKPYAVGMRSIVVPAPSAMLSGEIDLRMHNSLQKC